MDVKFLHDFVYFQISGILAKPDIHFLLLHNPGLDIRSDMNPGTSLLIICIDEKN